MRLRVALQIPAFIAVFFFALPSASIALNERLGWPRWQSAVADVLGTVLIAAGVGVFLYCSRLFWIFGRGTPAPNVRPPTHLVASGLYRSSRNPMYVAYVAIALGIFLVEGHLALLLYAGALFLLAQLYLVGWEEPKLVERFGGSYEEYRRRVPRWLRPPS